MRFCRASERRLASASSTRTDRPADTATSPSTITV